MRRYPLVVGGTAAGVVGVLLFHSTPVPISLSAAGTGASTASSASSGSSSTSTTAPPSTTSTPPSTTAASTGAPATTSANRAASSSAGASSTSSPPTTAPPKAAPTTTTTAAPTTTTTAASTAPRTVTGPAVNYYFGVLSVTVTASGTKITSVTIGSINDGGYSRSQAIDQYAIPLLEQQAMAAQSANIQGVSGASYTSAGFAQSLQGALKKLGI